MTAGGMTPAPTVIEADQTWTGESFETSVQIQIDENGRIADVGRLELAPTLRLPGRALLPGFVSAHSHAFQRGLRGRGERFPAGSGSFWTWRQAMYGLVESLDADTFESLCLRTFREMRRAGITTVGEFHYFHHGPEEKGWAFDERVLSAASAAGIRIALLEVYYRTGAIGQPLEGAQRRFGTPSTAEYWEHMSRLAARLDPRRQTLGASVHSLRAASLEDLREVYDEARRRDMVFHIHVEEQRREIEDALAYYGRRPMDLLLATLGTATDVTAVHCTHTQAEDMGRFLAGGGTVCICPLTEGNLGDGIAGLPFLQDRGGAICLGSDSNARISLLEEMRWLEYAQRLSTQSRGVLRDDEGQVANTLLHSATAAGAEALGVNTGRIVPGAWADLVAIDLTVPTLAGWEPETLLESLIFGAAEEAIAATCVGGEWEEYRGYS
jgi:formiminoglutamate deiminase